LDKTKSNLLQKGSLMKEEERVTAFLSQYDKQVAGNALKLREILFANLPGIIEQIDVPAKMIAYCYGQKYSDMICTIIPSKTGLKLGFSRGVDLPDPDNLLEGSGKISRYVQIRSGSEINSEALKKLIAGALSAYRQRTRS
jgi:hypothetical protein